MIIIENTHFQPGKDNIEKSQNEYDRYFTHVLRHLLSVITSSRNNKNKLKKNLIMCLVI